MTWVIGTATPFGYAAGLSDIRITFPDGTERDCLQKIHAVGRLLAAGFAGSVLIGLTMIDALRNALNPIPNSHAWKPAHVAKELQFAAQQIFYDSPEEAQKLGCEIILLGVHPLSAEEMKDKLFLPTEAYKLRWPDFEPIKAKPGEVLSVGSGNDVPPYQELLAELSEPSELTQQIEQLEAGMPGGMAQAFMLTIGKRIEENPAPGISSCLHLCLVSQTGVLIRNNNRKWITKRADLKDVVMPEVATSLHELERLLSANVGSLEQASC